MVTVVLLNWKRPANVMKIVRRLRGCSVIDRILVWDNSREGDVTYKEPFVTTIRSYRDLGLFTRFSAAVLARTDAILFHDDDILLPPDTVDQLHRSWSAQPNRLHTLFGRRLRDDGSYAKGVCPPDEAPISLTTAVMASRAVVLEALRIAFLPKIEAALAEGKPYGNGEDIILSYAATRLSGRPQIVHALPFKRLPAPHAIHWRWRIAHCDYRTRLIRALTATLSLPGPNTGFRSAR